MQPSEDFPPTTVSNTGLNPNQPVLDRTLSGIPKPASTVIFQEGRNRAALFLSEPEPWQWPPNPDVDMAESYKQWHTYIAGDGEHNSNAHEEGGNLIFWDGHATYSKYKRLTSLDFGLAGLDGNPIPWLPSEASSRRQQKPAF